MTGRVTSRLRVVLDTNVFVSAFLSRSPTSPTQELIHRWQEDEFVLLVSNAIIDELVEKLLDKDIDEERIVEFIGLLDRLAEWVEVPIEPVAPVIVADPDDDLVLACAVTGQADYLVTYDPHFEILGTTYQGIRITKAIPLLQVLRGEMPRPS